MRPLWEVSDFVRSMRRKLRFGALSRAPLKMQRIEWRSDALECDWTARPADVWDSWVPAAVARQNESLQTLADAISVRNIVFDTFRDIESAVLRVFRQPAREPAELVILGAVSREAPAVHRVSSLAMRAKLYGFCFCIEDGYLRPLQHLEEPSFEFIAQSTTPSGQGGIGNGGK